MMESRILSLQFAIVYGSEKSDVQAQVPGELLRVKNEIKEARPQSLSNFNLAKSNLKGKKCPT